MSKVITSHDNRNSDVLFQIHFVNIDDGLTQTVRAQALDAISY